MEEIGQKALFSGVQHSQGVSATNYTPNILRTGYETVIAHRTSELYSKPAKQDGKVVKIDKHGMVMEYADGSRDAFPLGLVMGEASGELHRHTRVTDLKVGDTFTKGDIVGWDEMYFARDEMNPGQVVWKAGVMGRIAMGETQFTFEDSVEISAAFAEETKTPYIKVDEFHMDFKEAVRFNVKTGDEVDYDAILCTIEEAHLIGVDDHTSEFAGLDRLGLKQVKSSHHGKVVKFTAEYNGVLEDMSDSLREFVKSCNKELLQLNNITGSGVTDGNVGGNTNIVRPAIQPGRVVIRVYIEDLNASENADKFVVGNQMKGTVGNIVNKTMRTLDGRVVHMIFSFKGLFNRMVLSLRDKMACCETAIAASKAAARAYRGK